MLAAYVVETVGTQEYSFTAGRSSCAAARSRRESYGAEAAEPMG